MKTKKQKALSAMSGRPRKKCPPFLILRTPQKTQGEALEENEPTISSETDIKALRLVGLGIERSVSPSTQLVQQRF